MHLKLSLLMVLSAKPGRQKWLTDQVWSDLKKMHKGEPTSAGLLDSGWWFSLHRWHVAWADGTACLQPWQQSHIYSPLFKYKLLACRSANCSDVLTLNRGTFERLCNLVPGFCHLCVLIRTARLLDELCTVVLTVKHMVSFHEAVWALVNSSLLNYNRVLVTWFPGFTRRRAASAQRWAAIIRSAFLPVWGLS